jgi:uncharacterized protein
VLKNRVRDDAGILPKDDESRFEIFLQMIDDESGVDIRFVLVPEVRGESLEDFSTRTARELGVGRDADRRGLLFVYDTSAHRLRIEVGATMEPIITDAFAGYLIREHVRNFFGTGNPSLGLRTSGWTASRRSSTGRAARGPASRRAQGRHAAGRRAGRRHLGPADRRRA